ncbi:MAG: transcriptional repressor [bacterium]
MTRQRQVILEEIKKTSSHPTATQVYELVKRRLPRISLGTVYRNLEVLSECEMVQKIALGNSERRFDGETTDHYHIRCIQCGQVDDIPVKPIITLGAGPHKIEDYEITGYCLEFTGLCPRCRDSLCGSPTPRKSKLTKPGGKEIVGLNRKEEFQDSVY